METLDLFLVPRVGHLALAATGKERSAVDVLHERAAALDIGKRDLKACVRTPHPSRRNARHSEVRTFDTTTHSLLQLRDWLEAEQVSIVVMAATGDYWRPPFYLLEDVLNVILVNAAHAKTLPGRKSDVADAVWLAQLAECGLLRASFVPPQPIRQLRDLTRYRTAFVAVEHTILTAVWHILSANTDYHDLGGDHHIRRNPDRARHRAIQALNQLGYTVTLNPIQAAA